MPDWWDWNAVGALGQWAGAAATTAAVIVALSAERRARMTRLAVSVTTGQLGEKMKGGAAFVISAVNNSGRAIILDGAAVLLPDGRELGRIVTEEFTGEIKDLERKEHRLAMETVARWLIEQKMVVPIRLRFYVRDTTGKQHKCASTFDPAPWNRG